MSAPWLHIIGVSEAGIAELSASNRALISTAKTVFAAKRFLSQIGKKETQAHVKWQAPFVTMTNKIIAERGTPTVILASGDPNWYGIGATLSRHLAPTDFQVYPALSSFQLAAAELNWPLQNIQTISLHGRSVNALNMSLFPGARILALTSNSAALTEICELLERRKYGHSNLNVLENLGGSKQVSHTFLACQFDQQNIGELYVLAIDCVADLDTPLLPLVPGLPDETYDHDGLLTKRHVRAISVSSLAPYPGALLWDIGAGSGSIGIEWMRAAKGALAICFEKQALRCEALQTNANNLGVPQLQIVMGDALENLADKPSPDAIFLGGNVADDDLFEACWAALKPGGKLVANAVTIQSIIALTKRQKTIGGDLFSIAISQNQPLGKSDIMQPKLPVTQWTVAKPTEGAS